MNEYEQLCEELEAKAAALMALFDAKPEMNFTEDELHDIQTRNRELDALGEKRDRMKDTLDIAKKTRDQLAEARRASGLKQPVVNRDPDQDPDQLDRERPVKSIGQQFVESAGVKEFSSGSMKGPEVELKGGRQLLRSFGAKALFDTTDYPFVAERLPGIVEQMYQRPVVADLVAQGEMTGASISYVIEQAETDGTAFTLEGNQYGESGFTFQEATATARKITAFIPITDEAMADLAALSSMIDTRLRSQVARKEDHSLLHGSGTAPEYYGMYNVAGILTQAKGVDPVPSAIYKAMTKIATTAFLEASGAIMHPLDWQDIQLLQDANGNYIWGSPADPSPKRIWGLPVVTTTEANQGSPLVGAFDTACQIFRREGVSLQASNSHADFFINGKLAIRIQERLAFVVYRPSAICEVTGV